MSRYNIIHFEKNSIVIIIDNKDVVWFNAKQISISLGYKHAKQAIIYNVDNDDKIQLKNMNIHFEIQQHPDTIYINESGLV